MTYQLVQQWQEKAVPVTQACRVLGVSRAGYYQRRHRMPPAKDARASAQVKAAFTASGKSYGSRRVRKALARRGVQLARELNSTQQAVSRMEKDASGLAFARVYEVLSVLDMQLAAEPRRPFKDSIEGW